MKTGTRLLTLTVTISATISAVLAAPATAAKPPVAGMLVPLPALPGGSASGAWDVNDSGVIVGWSNNATTSRAVKWPTSNTVVDLGGLPGSTGSGAAAINNNGVIVGTSTVNGTRLPTKWAADGTATELPAPDGYSECTPKAVNDYDVVVGNCSTSDGQRSVRWATDGSVSVLDNAGSATAVEKINNDGVIVGSVNTGTGSPNAARWTSDGLLAELPHPSGSTSGALGLNNLGQITGWVRADTMSAVRWESTGDPVYQAKLPGAADRTSRGFDLNTGGTVVGEGQAADGRWVAIRWGANGSVTRLATLASSGPGTIDFATAVNEKGAIVGSSGANAVLWAGYR